MQVVATKASLHFYTQQEVDEAVAVNVDLASESSTEKEEVKIWTDADEWSVSPIQSFQIRRPVLGCRLPSSSLSQADSAQDWNTIGDPVLHIELRRWADLVLIAPCSADFLAKLAAGFSDNLAVSGDVGEVALVVFRSLRCVSLTPYYFHRSKRTYPSHYCTDTNSSFPCSAPFPDPPPSSCSQL